MKKVKWTKSGLKTMKGEFGQAIEQHAVVAITTVSLKTVLDIFEDKIIQIYAHSAPSLNVNLDTLKEIGAKFEVRKKIDFTLNYDKLGRSFPLFTPRSRYEKLINKMKEHNIVDGVVNEMIIHIKDPIISFLAKKYYPSIFSDHYLRYVNDEFFAIFRNDPCDSALDIKKIREHDVNRRLILLEGFKNRILHCRALVPKIEVVRGLPTKKRHYLIRWTGSTMSSLESYYEIASAVKKHIKRGFGLLKYYKAGKEETLILEKVER